MEAASAKTLMARGETWMDADGAKGGKGKGVSRSLIQWRWSWRGEERVEFGVLKGAESDGEEEMGRRRKIGTRGAGAAVV